MKRIGLVSIGAYVPEKRLTNNDLSKMVDTNDEWITSRTGIKERRIAAENEFASDMAVEAARRCLDRTKYKPDLLISSTSTAEKGCPYQASIVSNKLKLTNLSAFDLNAACSGFIYSIAAASSMLRTTHFKHALITASEKMSSVTDYTDRNSCILFGDAAAAVMISRDKFDHEIIATELGLDPTGSDLVVMKGQGKDFYFRQEGQKVFKFAVNKVGELIDNLKKKIGLKKKDKFFVVPHQANMRIIEAVCKNKHIPQENFITNIDRFGNTSSASIGLALEEAWRENRFQKGDFVFLIGFGGGLSWASAAIKW